MPMSSSCCASPHEFDGLRQYRAQQRCTHAISFNEHHGSMEAWKHGSIADSLERCPEPREWQSDPRPHDGEDAIVPGRQNYVP